MERRNKTWETFKKPKVSINQSGSHLLSFPLTDHPGQLLSCCLSAPYVLGRLLQARHPLCPWVPNGFRTGEHWETDGGLLLPILCPLPGSKPNWSFHILAVTVTSPPRPDPHSLHLHSKPGPLPRAQSPSPSMHADRPWSQLHGECPLGPFPVPSALRAMAPTVTVCVTS